MKRYGDWMFERRFGGVTLRYDFHSWGLGVEMGAFRDDWLFLAEEGGYYWTAWVRFKLGPCSLEIFRHSLGRKYPLPGFKPFGELRIGTVFEVNENMDAIKINTFAGLTGDGRYLHYCEDDQVQTWDYIWGE